MTVIIQTQSSQEASEVVFVVDDDSSIRESLKDLLASVGLDVRAFASAQEFLRGPRPDAPGCLVLDIRMPGMSGLDLQREMADLDIRTPIIFITAHGDIHMTVRAMKAGAVEYLTKPLDDEVVIRAIREAVERGQANLKREGAQRQLQERYDSLTKREREVMNLVVTGLMNKQVGFELDISEITVKAHRGKVMQKMRADSLPDLVKMAGRLGMASSKA